MKKDYLGSASADLSYVCAYSKPMDTDIRKYKEQKNRYPMSYLGYDEKKYRPSIQLCSSRAKLSTYIRVGKVITEVTRTNTDLRFSFVVPDQS